MPAPLSRKRGNIPGTIDAVVCQALAKEPSARPATAGAFAFLLSLQTTGNEWLREQADAVNRQYRGKLIKLAVRLQWPSWLLTGLVLIATVKLPGLRPLHAGLVFGFLWLMIAAVTLWKQNSVTAACTLFLEQMRNTAKTEIDLRNIVRAIRSRSGAIARATWAELAGLASKLLSFKPAEISRWADSTLIVPPLIQEDLSVNEAERRSAKLIEPLRRKLTYPFFRRMLAFGLALTVLQTSLMIWALALDREPDRGRMELYQDITFKLLVILVLCFTAFSFALKNSIEQAMLYLTARQALGEITAEEVGLPLRQDVEARPNRGWPSFKTYAPTCALLLLTGALQFQKFPVMSAAIYGGRINTVKALQATGVPLPFWALEGSPPTGFRRWIRKVLFPNERRYLQPYLYFILKSHSMTEFMIEKGVDINATRLTYSGDLTPPGIGGVTLTPLHVALAARRVEIARLLIERGADVHARDSIGRTPLTVAITYCPAAIEMLLASGVDINEETRFGRPLLAAARYQWLYTWRKRMRQRENAVKILLEKGADPNTRDKDGRNALMVMSMEYRPVSPRDLMRGGPVSPFGDVPHGNVFVVVEEDSQAMQSIGEALLQAGCDVNAADSNGRTPLMYAARYRRPAAVRLLLIGGADINAKDKDGKTALDLARQFGAKEIIRILESPHAQPGNK